MVVSPKSNENEHPAEQLSVEMSPSMYHAILDLMKANELAVEAEQLFKILEARLGDTVAHTVAEITGIKTPFPQGVEVDLQVGEAPDEIDDSDAYVRESIKQGLRDVLKGDVLTEDEFWQAVADDE